MRSDQATRSALVAVLLFLICGLSFAFNAFRILPQEMYTEHQADSDALVMDALTSGSSILVRKADGIYQPYLSQFGGQLQAYRLLERMGFPKDRLGLLNTLLLALVVSVLSFAVSREILGLWGGLAFGLCLALSPWLVAFSKSIYWMAWTWFLPLLVTTTMGRHMLRTGGWLALALAILYACFFWKLLSGYEFASSIVIAACAPLVFFTLKDRTGVRRGLFVIVLVGATSLLAFASAITLHALKTGNTLSEGLQIVHATAAKRVALGSVEASAREGCLATPAENFDTCYQNIVRSLSAPRSVVLASYLTFRGSVPWLTGPDVIDDPALEPMRRALRRLDIRAAMSEMAQLPASAWMAAARLPLTTPLIMSILAICSLLLWRNRPGSAPYAALIGVSACAPLSWFIVASGHAYGHLQLNFVLWMLPFLPFVAGYIVATLLPSRQPGANR